MKVFMPTITALIVLSLTGCGGGGGGSSELSSASPVATDAQPTPAQDNTPPPATENPQESVPVEVTTTSDLVLADEFSLQSHVAVSVAIDIAGLENASGYLSICSQRDQGEAASGEEPDYQNCFIRTALGDSNYATTLNLSTAQKVAYSAIWFLDLSREPIITRHDLASGKITLSL